LEFPVLVLAFWMFTVAVVLGAALTLYPLGFLKTRWKRLGVAHGILAAATLVVLIVALKKQSKTSAYAMQSFGLFTVVLAVLALVAGIAIFLHRQRAPAGWLVGLHATFGIAAYIFLLAYVTFA
jgi:hypothetical protein